VSEVERYAATTFARAYRVVHAAGFFPLGFGSLENRAPRRLFGLVFESRPPPLLA
jgi:hypothetical protein